VGGDVDVHLQIIWSPVHRGDTVPLAKKRTLGQKRGLLSRLGVHMVEDMLSTVEERAMRAHFGM
jgi:hypothetical protein